MDNTPSTEEILGAFKKTAEQAESLNNLMKAYLGKTTKPATKLEQPNQSNINLSLETLLAYRKNKKHGVLIDSLQMMSILSENPHYLKETAVLKMAEVWGVSYQSAAVRLQKVREEGLLSVYSRTGRKGVRVAWA
jgi:hypothetical protein